MVGRLDDRNQIALAVGKQLFDFVGKQANYANGHGVFAEGVDARLFELLGDVFGLLDQHPVSVAGFGPFFMVDGGPRVGGDDFLEGDVVAGIVRFHARI